MPMIAPSVPTGDDSYSAPSDDEYQVRGAMITPTIQWFALSNPPQAPGGEYAAPEESYGPPGRDTVSIFTFLLSPLFLTI